MTDLHSHFYFLYRTKPTAWLLASPLSGSPYSDWSTSSSHDQERSLNNVALLFNWLLQPRTVRTGELHYFQALRPAHGSPGCCCRCPYPPGPLAYWPVPGGYCVWLPPPGGPGGGGGGI